MMTDDTQPFVPPLPPSPECETPALGQAPTNLDPTTPSAVPGVDGSTLPTSRPAAVSALGGTIGRRYQVLSELDHGGMGVVYKAADRLMGRTVALKMIRAGFLANPGEMQRFTREAKALAQLSHPNVIPIFDYGVDEERPFFTMQLVEGGSLVQHLQRFQADPRSSVTLLEKVARALHHAHQRGILHRDLKPANVLLGPNDEPLVSDFGLVKFLDATAEALTQTGAAPGTAPYMAPEQALGRKQELSPRTDVWALGVMLYELLCASRPFSGQSREETMHLILTTPVPALRSRRPDIDPRLEAVVMKCLEKDAARRYQSAAELADDLARWLRGELPSPSVQESTEVRDKPRRRSLPRTLLALAALLALVLVVGFALWAFFHHADPQTSATEPDPSITLIGKGEPTRAHHWVLGQESATPIPSTEGFSFATTKAAALQLLDAPPWDAYRLEARIRHDAGTMGSAGLYFGRIGRATDKGPCQQMFMVSFADVGALNGQLEMEIWRLPDANPILYSTANCFRDFPFDSAAKLNAPPGWHRLAVEITPAECKVFWDNKYLRTISSQHIESNFLGLFPDAQGLIGDPIPQGGIGIFQAHDSTATFQDVVIAPLTSRH
jgi:serine/threonine-protein kinase